MQVLYGPIHRYSCTVFERLLFDCCTNQFLVNVASDAADKSDDGSETFIPLSALNRRKHTPNWYGRCIARFGRAGKVGEVCVFFQFLIFTLAVWLIDSAFVFIRDLLYCYIKIYRTRFRAYYVYIVNLIMH